MNTGMKIRNRRIFSKDGRTFIIPFDHGISAGMMSGLENVEKIVRIANKYADAIMVRPGLMRKVSRSLNSNVGIILCLTGRLYKGVDHVKLNSVFEAIRNGADAVCVEFKVGSVGDLENVAMASEIIEEAHTYGLPVLVTVYAQPEYIEIAGKRSYVDICRIAEEIGGDYIKTNIPDDADILAECVKATSIPIILAGGEQKTSNIEERVERALNAGIRGIAIGRNVWGDLCPEKKAISFRNIVHT